MSNSNPITRKKIATGVIGRALSEDLEAIREDQHAKNDEYFTYHLGVREADMPNVPFDLRDRQPNGLVTAKLTPLPSVVKTGDGDDDHIGHGGSSLVETLIFFAHPFITLASMLLVALFFGHAPLLGLAFFLGGQAAYAHYTLPLFGRNWRYLMRPTVKTAVSIAVVQVLLAMVLPPSLAAPLLILGNLAMLARPFLEARHVNRGLGRPLPVTGYFAPDMKNEAERRAQQINGAKDLAKNGPFITLGYATGKFRSEGHPFAPDKGMPMGGSVADLGKHLAVFGTTGTGKTYGIARPFAQQWMTLGTKQTIIANGVKKIIWRNAGGTFIMDNKAELGRDLISDARKLHLDAMGIPLIEVGTGAGCVPIAPMEGNTPTDIAQALLDIKRSGHEFFDSQSHQWIQAAGVLLEGAIDVQTMRFDQVAKDLKHPTTGQPLGFKSYAHLVATYEKMGKSMPQWMLAKFKREFIWYWPHLDQMCKDFIEDKLFLEGVVPNGPNGKPIKGYVSRAPKMPANVGLVGLLKELDYYKDRLRCKDPSLSKEEQDYYAKGVMLENAINHAIVSIPKMEPEARNNVRATVESWLNTATTSRKLIPWLQLEKGADVTACLRGAMVGLSLSKIEHQDAGMFFLELAKRRFFNAILSRPADWRNDPEQRPVLLEVDEAQGFLSRDKENQEAAILQMARSKGCVALFLTQHYAEYEDRLNHAGAKAFAGNFNSFVSFESEPSTLEWVRDKIGKHRLVGFDGGFEGLDSGSYAHKLFELPVNVDDPKEMERLHAERAFALTYPADVVLTEDDKSDLSDDGHKGHTGLHLRAHLASMFTVDLVVKSIPNTLGALAADLAMVKAWVKRVYHAHLRKGGAKTVAVDDKPVAPISFFADVKDDAAGDNAIEPFFNTSRWGLLKGDYVCVASFKRGGGAVREDIMNSIGVLSIAQIRELAARQPGVTTIFDELEAQGIAYQ